MCAQRQIRTRYDEPFPSPDQVFGTGGLLSVSQTLLGFDVSLFNCLLDNLLTLNHNFKPLLSFNFWGSLVKGPPMQIFDRTWTAIERFWITLLVYPLSGFAVHHLHTKGHILRNYPH